MTARREVLRIDPLHFQAWDSLVEGREDGSFFHGTAWAAVLRASYGHRPAYFCRIKAARLESLLAVMEVRSLVTGRKGVALPFTDYCNALGTEDALTAELFQEAVRYGAQQGWRYLEFRGDLVSWTDASPSVAFHAHTVRLDPSPNNMSKAFESSVRRDIRKAEESGLTVGIHQDPRSMNLYYDLHCRTRRRHGVPPQPKRFFDNIARFVLAANRGFVALARNAGQPVAGAVYFHRGGEAIFKFAASDPAFRRLHPNHLVMWESLKHLANMGCSYLHMGRTSLGNEGLRSFKRSFGALERRIEYARYDLNRRAFVKSTDRAESWANSIFRLMPVPMLRLAGKLLYPQIA